MVATRRRFNPNLQKVRIQVGESSRRVYVCTQAARGIMDVQLTSGVPCAFGVITCDTREQAEARAGGDKRDQGRQAAYAVMRSALNRRKVLG
jgi:6,7-dimethyl-8-ribityllumazine synthase